MPVYTVNKKARHDYEILETIEGGLVLTGAEVKSVRSGQVNLKGAYVVFNGSEASLLNAHISPYKFAAKVDGYDPTASRRILLHKKELLSLQQKTQEKGLTLVPLSIYTKARYIKIEIALVKGKKQYDKRRDIKERELKRETSRAIKNT
jgi:SsrA-binding protein